MELIDILGAGGVDAKIDVGGIIGTQLWWAAGLTLVHFSAQLKRFVWDRGCAQGLCSPC